jgi:hypothetical protein
MPKIRQTISASAPTNHDYVAYKLVAEAQANAATLKKQVAPAKK